MHGAQERRRSSGGADDHRRDSSDDEGFEVEDDELITDSRSSSSQFWWKRRFSLKRSESSTNATTVETTAANASRTSSSSPSNSLFSRMVIHPDNWWYVGWTHFILLWAVYSSFFTPLEFGFFRGLPENLFMLDSCGQIAFLIDIIVRFFVAYRDFHSHRIVYDRHLIALRYLKSRFLVDFLGCLPWDAIYKASGREEAVRYLLWIRLSRARRVTEFFEKLEKDIRINYLFTRIAKLFVVELYSTHTAACIFYYLATTMPPSQEGYTWIGSLKMGDYSYAHFREIDLWKRYITSLYFAVVTMATVGYGEIHAVNVREMIFIMFYVSFDMILGAYLLGNIAALIVKGSKTEKFRDKMADLIKYMNRNRIDRGISREIKNHLRLQYDRSYTEAAVLQDIPASIRSKISQKLYEPYIKEVHLFKGCSTGFIKQIATRIHEEFFLPAEVIIEQGDVVDHLYIVCHGELEKLGSGEDDDNDELLERLQTYSSFGEVSFLCNTPQPYAVRVCQLCRVLRLDRQSFREILEIYFLDGRLILDNLLEGKDLYTRNKLLESDITLYIGKHEMELVMKVNCAAYDGDFYRVKRLIGAGVDPNKVDYAGRSPLHVAASKGYEDITRFLIEKGGDVKMSDKFGNTPLLEAIKNGHDQVASLLVQAGASLTIEDAGDFLCATVARRDLDLVKRLLANDMNPNAKNYDQRSPLHVAASEGLYPMAEFLLEAGASVLSKDRWGKTPLDEARIGGSNKLMQLLESTRLSQLSEFSDGSQVVN
ncbi:potassium channel SKOR [Rosa sericea]